MTFLFPGKFIFGETESLKSRENGLALFGVFAMKKENPAFYAWSTQRLRWDCWFLKKLFSS